MPPPRLLSRSRERRMFSCRFAVAGASLLLLAIMYHTISWSSSVILKVQEDDLRLRRYMKPRRELPVTRNGAMRRHDRSRITHYDRQQDIHHHYSHIDKPRVLFMFSSSFSSSRHRSVTMLSNSTGAVDPQKLVLKFERQYVEECTLMEKWQSEFYPTCNKLHEVQDDELLSTRGSWRSVWTIQEDENVVLKMLQLYRNFDHESFGYHQVDAMAMERLTKSKHIVDAYGFCGQSVLVERSKGEGRMLLKDKSLGAKKRLALARDLARGVNDMHSMDTHHGENATFCHNDINIANLVAVDHDKIKFNDFNIGYLLKWNTATNKPCGFPQRWEGKLWRSPEDLRNTTYVSEKTDVYSLGNLFFQVIARHQPWTHLEPTKLSLDEVADRKRQGKLPYMPTKYRNSTDIAVQAVYEAMKLCLRDDPEKRPTAYQIYHGLSRVLKWIEQGKKEKVTADVFLRSR